MVDDILDIRKSARRASGGDVGEAHTWNRSAEDSGVSVRKKDITPPRCQGEHLYGRRDYVKDASISGDWTAKESEEALQWLNGVLNSKGQKPVSDLRQLGDGYTLPILLEILTSKCVVKGLQKPPVLRVQRIGNVQKCLTLITQSNVRLHGINAEDVVNGNLKSLLGLCHCLKLRLKVSSKEAWRKARISPERPLRSASTSSPRSPHTKQAWVHGELPVEQQMDVLVSEQVSADDKAKMVEDKLLELLHSPEISCADQEHPGDSQLGNDAVDREDDGILASTEYVPSDPSKEARRRSSGPLTTPGTASTHRNEDLVSPVGPLEHNAVLKTSSASVTGSSCRQSFLSSATVANREVSSRRAKSLPSDRRGLGADDDSPLSQLVPSMRRAVTPGRQTSSTSATTSRQSSRVRSSPLYDLGKQPARPKKLLVQASWLQQEQGKESKLKPQNHRDTNVSNEKAHRHPPLSRLKISAVDAIHVQGKDSPKEITAASSSPTRRRGSRGRIQRDSMRQSQLSRDSVASIPDFSPTVLKQTELALESRPHAPPPQNYSSMSSSDEDGMVALSPIPVTDEKPAQKGVDGLIQPLAVSPNKMSLKQLLQQVSASDPNSVVNRLLTVLVAEVSDLKMQQETMMSRFEEERQILRSQLSQQAKTVNSLRTKGSRSHHHSNHARSLKRRFSSLQCHVVELARNSAKLTTQFERQHQLQEEVESLKRTVQEQSAQLRLNGSVSDGFLSPPSGEWISMSPQSAGRNLPSIELHNPQQIDKLTRFFGEEPPLLKKFLKTLGYEKLSPKFEKEKVTMLELPYLDEERLTQLGIPMGPRARILFEVQQLKQRAMSPTRETQSASS